jgi:hypothetical protein
VSRDPYNPYDEKQMGLAMLGTILFCTASGAGVGVFFQAPEIGGIIGGLVGIVIGLIVVPGLMRDWHD